MTIASFSKRALRQLFLCFLLAACFDSVFEAFIFDVAQYQTRSAIIHIEKLKMLQMRQAKRMNDAMLLSLQLISQMQEQLRVLEEKQRNVDQLANGLKLRVRALDIFIRSIRAPKEPNR